MVSLIRSVCDDPMMKASGPQGSNSTPCASSSNSVVTALDSDHPMSSHSPSDNRKHKHDDVITPLRRVTSDVTGTPLLRSTPVRKHHSDVILRTPATTVCAPDLTGRPIMHRLGLNKVRYA